MKKCSRCSELKELEEFGRDRKSKDGRRYWCRPCSVASSREYHQTPAGRESYRRRNAKYHQTPAGREAQRRAEAKYRQSPAGREAGRRNTAKRRTRKLGNGVFTVITRDERRLLSQSCQHAHLGPCNGPMHLDHILPLSRGGRHSIGNLQMLCEHHNVTKHNRLEIEVRHRTLSSTNALGAA